MRILTALIPLAIVGIVAVTPIIHFTTMEQVSFTVTDRERIQTAESSRYMIWADMPNGSSEVFENTDSILSLKFNSADLQGRMREGNTCDATVNGFRVPFLSMNRNILEVSCR